MPPANFFFLVSLSYNQENIVYYARHRDLEMIFLSKIWYYQNHHENAFLYINWTALHSCIRCTYAHTKHETLAVPSSSRVVLFLCFVMYFKFTKS